MCYTGCKYEYKRNVKNCQKGDCKLSGVKPDDSWCAIEKCKKERQEKTLLIGDKEIYLLSA